MLWITLLNWTFADTIDSVLVFTDRAEITRQGTAKCSNNTAEITFTQLPFSTDTKTLRSEILSDGSIVGVRHRTVTHDQSIDARAQVLLKKRSELNQDLRSKMNEDNRLAKELGLLSQYEKQFAKSLKVELNATKDLRAKWGAGLQTLSAEKLKVSDAKYTVSQQITDLQLQIGLINSQLNRLNVQPTQQSIEATVLTKCTGTSTVQATLNYVVPSASWTPESDLFVESNGDGQNVKLQVSAQIRQATGEDWTNARITLSTAQPNLGSYALYPSPIRVSGKANKEQKVMVQSTEDRSSLSNAGAVSYKATSVAIDDNGQSMQLSLPHKTTILSNGQPHWVPIDVVQTDGSLQNISIPRATPYVFETVTFTNPTAYSLLGGSMHLYKDGVYVGDHHHSTTAPGEKMEISLGTLAHLRVERKTLTDKRKTKMLGKSQQLTRAYSISILNNSSETEPIQIREAIPLSKNEDIQVTLSNEETTGTYEVDQYKGFVTWSMDLEAGKRETVQILYNIQVPSDWQMN